MNGLWRRRAVIASAALMLASTGQALAPKAASAEVCVPLLPDENDVPLLEPCVNAGVGPTGYPYAAAGVSSGEDTQVTGNLSVHEGDQGEPAASGRIVVNGQAVASYGVEAGVEDYFLNDQHLCVGGTCVLPYCPPQPATTFCNWTDAIVQENGHER